MLYINDNKRMEIGEVEWKLFFDNSFSVLENSLLLYLIVTTRYG